MITLEAFKSYWDTYLTHPDIEKVVVGDIDDLIAIADKLQPTEAPVLFVSFPFRDSTPVNEAEASWEELSLLVTIYDIPSTSPRVKEADKKIQCLSKIEPIIKAVYTKFYYDCNYSETYPFGMEAWTDWRTKGPNPSNPITTKKFHGWSFGVDLKINDVIPYDESLWQQ
ncbi:hypothetical protein [Flammeovirga aprica]|uniref:Uncharacterized protein n=1 Tax=Flammeovirga aprica JL-4 TaxID=694437 RepID=A0A7X9P2H8_9BACT|nr:hypothetical protein [Flammeovirga aprica]NME67212.1 hypothetical protein [Flammeovirga aprica JL-4]